MPICDLRKVFNEPGANVYVWLRVPMFGHSRGRLVGVGRKIVRVMFGNGEILNLEASEIVGLV